MTTMMNDDDNDDDNKDDNEVANTLYKSSPQAVFKVNILHHFT
jgi:hypothetical protein